MHSPIKCPVFVVSSKQFIRSVARQCHRYILLCQSAYQKSGYLRTIGKRLVPDPRQVWDDGPGVGGGHAKLGVIGAQLARDPGGRLGLVIPGLTEADGERADRA